jgi:hypothetical protein
MRLGSTALATERVERRLAAILAADVAGYSRLMGTDEDGTLARLKALRRELADPKIKEHRGRIVKTTGDGPLLDPVVLGDAAYVLAELGKKYRGAMIALVDRALALNPSYVHGWFRGGAVRVHVGKFDLAIERANTLVPPFRYWECPYLGRSIWKGGTKATRGDPKTPGPPLAIPLSRLMLCTHGTP